MHEMNGDLVPVARRRATATRRDDFKRACAPRAPTSSTRDGARNVSWVFSIDTLAGGTPTPHGRRSTTYYPGDRYVDWVGLSGFNWGAGARRPGASAASCDTFQPAYDVLERVRQADHALRDRHRRHTAATRPAWLASAHRRRRRDCRRVKALVWFDADTAGAPTSGSAPRRVAGAAQRRRGAALLDAAATLRDDAARRLARSGGEGVGDRRGAPVLLLVLVEPDDGLQARPACGRSPTCRAPTRPCRRPRGAEPTSAIQIGCGPSARRRS